VHVMMNVNSYKEDDSSEVSEWVSQSVPCLFWALVIPRIDGLWGAGMGLH